MNLLTSLIGEGEHLSSLQMGIRALLLFIITLLLIHISGLRTFAKKSAFDIILAIMLGAVLSRAITGASPFVPTVTAGLVLALMHRLLGWLGLRSGKLGQIIKGKEIILYENREFREDNLRRNLLSRGDLEESLRLHMHADSLDGIDKIIMERSGRISFVVKEQKV